MVKISAYIVTLNEEKRLGKTLQISFLNTRYYIRRLIHFLLPVNQKDND